MILPVLVFLPGTHGNFIARCLSVASGVQPDFDFYDSNFGAHAKTKFNKIVTHTHYPEETKKKDIFCYVEFDDEDNFILNWHAYYASAESGLNLLQVNDFIDIQEFVTKNKDIIGPNIHAQSFKFLMDNFQDNGISGLRELFKKRLTVDNHRIKWQDQIKKYYHIHNIFKFSWCYNKKMFCRQIEKICVKLGYEYKVDVTHHIEEFIEKKQDIIQAHAFVNRAFNSYKNKKEMDISTLSIYEQAYLDSLIEKDLGYEIELWEEYPKNTIDLNPVQAWEGKRYDI